MECGKLEGVCKYQSEVLTTEKIYLVDLKSVINSGGIKVYDAEPEYEALLLDNQSQTAVELVAFEENAFEIKRGRYKKQCECALFPYGSDEISWLLFVEMKYAKNEYNIQRDDWHKKAVEQIRSTVDFLRSKGAIAEGENLNAIISFPKISTFSAWLADYVKNELKSNNITARCTNKATIVDGKVLILA